jgi:tetratricopeptide (TPR) repeat protein
MKKQAPAPAANRQARQLESKLLSLARAGRKRDALTAAQALNENHPGYASGWYTSSQLIGSLGNPAGALRAIEKAISLEPGESRWQLQKAFCLLQSGQWHCARTIALALDVNELASGYQCASLGLLLAKLGENTRALHHYQRAVLLEPELGEHYYNLATVQRFLGDFAGAEESLALAIHKNPEDFEAYKLRSDLRRQTAADNHIESLREVLATHRGNPRGSVALHYALAKELEDVGQWQASFAQLQQGAQVRRSLMRYDVQGDLDTMSTIAEVYDAALLKGALAGFDNSQAIFIVGMPRTGTTLVEQILGSHSRVQALGELNNFALELTKSVQSSLPLSGRSQKMTKTERVRHSAGIDFRRLGEAYIQSVRPGSDHPVLFFTDKMPVNFLYAGLIHLALPQAKIIHLRRHPMDACYAIFKNLFADAYPFSYQLSELARYYAAYDRLMAHWRQVMPGIIHEVHYEHLVSGLETESRKLLQYCDLQWESQCLEYHRSDTPVTTASASQVRQPVYSTSVGKWRHFARELRPLQEALEAEGVDLDGG